MDPLWWVFQSMTLPVLNLLSTSAILSLYLALLFLMATLVILTYYYMYFWLKRRRRKEEADDDQIVGLFHPYCDAGGGGERVLWCAISSFQTRFPALKIKVYTGDLDAAPDQILGRAKDRFNLDKLDGKRIEFVYLHRRKWVEASMYPHFTLMGQSVGSIYLGFEAMDKCMPDIFIDTMGYAFTLPIFKYFAKAKVGCYVHYPTISTDMLEKVRKRKAGYNNRRGISSSPLATYFKLWYYKLFAWLYGCAGKCSDLNMVNSSWTEDHISQLWGGPGKVIHKIYPPCDVSKFREIKRKDDEDTDEEGMKKILSLGQFRPEKDHALQIRAMFELRQIISEEQWEKVRLVLIGGCRNAEDEARVKDLRDLCKHLSVEDNVDFQINIPFNALCQEMAGAFMGIHTMWNEHFGIAVVEMLAAGLLTLAHRSGGPLMDIIVEESNGRNGFLADKDKEYAAAIAFVLNMSPEGRKAIRDRARSSVDRFSQSEFESGWIRATDALVNSH